jgi:ferredoxin-NADP reductase
VLGRVDAGLLAEAGKGLRDPNWYVCGGPGMVRATITTLLGMGIAQERIVYEAFFGYS